MQKTELKYLPPLPRYVLVTFRTNRHLRHQKMQICDNFVPQLITLPKLSVLEMALDIQHMRRPSKLMIYRKRHYHFINPLPTEITGQNLTLNFAIFVKIRPKRGLSSAMCPCGGPYGYHGFTYQLAAYQITHYPLLSSFASRLTR